VFDTLLARVVRLAGVRSAWRRWPVGSVATRIAYDVFPRPHYAYGVYSAAQLARSLGLPGISVIEFGVAGGSGLVALEATAREVAAAVQIRIDVIGFDTGSGMPEASDYRDLPHVWAKGFYKMDVELLKSRLTTAKLVLGDVAETIPEWISAPGTLPVGFIAFDLDYYSSTMNAFRIFEGPCETRLPRLYCYFDDMIWPETAGHNEFVGELRAIADFNQSHSDRKLSAIHLLRHTRLNPAPWNDQMYVLHDFVHRLYCVNVTPKGDRNTEIPLR
jgi:hypothetical protein